MGSAPVCSVHLTTSCSRPHHCGANTHSDIIIESDNPLLIMLVRPEIMTDPQKFFRVVLEST